METAQEGKTKIVSLLLKAGANTNLQDKVCLCWFYILSKCIVSQMLIQQAKPCRQNIGVLVWLFQSNQIKMVIISTYMAIL